MDGQNWSSSSVVIRIGGAPSRPYRLAFAPQDSRPDVTQGYSQQLTYTLLRSDDAEQDVLWLDDPFAELQRLSTG